MRAAITGATHGIGKRTAEVLMSAGWEVIGCASDRNDTRGAEMEKENSRFGFMYCDVSDEDQVMEFFRQCGPIDAAFNNAGRGCAPRAAHLADISEARRIIDVNIIGTALCMKYECLSMLKSGGGVIVNNSSVSAVKAATGADPVYSASKAAVMRLTAEAAVCKEYMGKIRFFTLVPGWIETRMTACDNKEEWARFLPSGKAGSTDEAAELVAEIFAGAEKFRSGQEFYVDGGGSLI